MSLPPTLTYLHRRTRASFSHAALARDNRCLTRDPSDYYGRHRRGNSHELCSLCRLRETRDPFGVLPPVVCGHRLDDPQKQSSNYAWQPGMSPWPGGEPPTLRGTFDQ
ncbi:Uncharacterised protein [Mycolicibacterium vanbaalenii]|uniref:Uncharacterized protein n=1 Tax=Mycolicibacterium vanbaalenii TaxID=110539 RepID=A0A5S9R457_MYCVN|nr:hypothetical protein [Mycolicibacterium vanbaalenii]CAA0129299.1 Uncharacterised protein [Mycolicibacterium vanbaalenii]